MPPAVPTSGAVGFGHLSLGVSESSPAIETGLTVLCLAFGACCWRRPFTTGKLINYIISYAFVRVGRVSRGVTQLHLACQQTTQRSLLQPSESCGPLCILSLNRPLATRSSLPTAQPLHTLLSRRMVAKKVKGLERKGSHSRHSNPSLSFPDGKPCTEGF